MQNSYHLPEELPSVYSDSRDIGEDMPSYAGDAKQAQRSRNFRACFFFTAVCVGLMVGLLIGAGVASAIIIPVMAKDNNDKSRPEGSAEIVTNSPATNNGSPYRLIAQSGQCEFGCPPHRPWCPRGAMCDCEPCVAGEPTSKAAAGAPVTFRMRVYARVSGGSEYDSMVEKLPCYLLDAESGKPLGANCSDYPTDDDVAAAAEAAAAAEEEEGAEGNRSAGDRIQGGTAAPSGAYKHQIMFQTASGSVCGGSILSAEWVLTAAHCCEGQTVSNCGVRVMFGRNAYVWYDGYGGGSCSAAATSATHRCVEQVYMHPWYDTENLYYDVCLLRLSKPLPASTSWAPINIYSTYPSTGTAVTAIGWGLNRWGGSIQSNLMHVTLSSQNSAKLRQTWGGFISDGHVGGTGSGKGTCSGDSGGPLLIKVGTENQLMGVTSFGPYGNCAHSTLASVFWRPSYTGGWLQQTMNLAHPCTPNAPCTTPTPDSEGCSNVPNGGTCTPRCSTGYTLVDNGSGAMTCNGGTWSRNFQCMQMCGTPPVTGAVGCQDTPHGGKCTPQCATGSAPTSTTQLTCSDGAYGGTFTCVSSSCSQIAVTRGSCAGTGPFDAGSACTPTCQAGYSVSEVTATPIMCSNRAWTGTFKCRADCKTPAVAQATGCNPTTHGGKCTPQCASGYVPSSSTQLTCNDGAWTGTTFSCKAAPCDEISVPFGNCGKAATALNYASGTACKPRCATGYTMVYTVAPSPPRCNFGAWSGSFACRAPCQPVTVPRATGACTAAGAHGKRCLPACAAGFTPSRTAELVCDDGTWSATYKCLGTQCAAPQIENGHCSEAGPYAYNVQNTCTLECNVGFWATSAARTLTCQDDSTWTGGPLLCSPMPCNIGSLCGGVDRTLQSGESCTPVTCAASGRTAYPVTCLNGQLQLSGPTSDFDELCGRVGTGGSSATA